jgi:hypothetical protein
MRRPCIRVDGANSGRHGVRTASIVARIVLHHPGVELSQRRNCLSREAFPAFCTLHLLYIMRTSRRGVPLPGAQRKGLRCRQALPVSFLPE